jgi:hypothetical protein
LTRVVNPGREMHDRPETAHEISLHSEAKRSGDHELVSLSSSSGRIGCLTK